MAVDAHDQKLNIASQLVAKAGLLVQGYSEYQKYDTEYTKAGLTYYGSVFTALSASVAVGATTISVVSATGLPPTNFVFTVDSEQMLVVSVSGTTLTLQSPAKSAHALGAPCSMAGDFDASNLKHVDPTQIPTLITQLRAFKTWIDTSGNGDIFFKVQPGA